MPSPGGALLMHRYSVLLLDTYFAGSVSISGARIAGTGTGADRFWGAGGSGGEARREGIFGVSGCAGGHPLPGPPPRGGDSHHGPLSGLRLEIPWFCLSLHPPPGLHQFISTSPDTAFHWISPRTAPAPGGGGGGRRPGGVGLRVPLPGETGEGVGPPPPNGDVHHGPLSGVRLEIPGFCLSLHPPPGLHRSHP